VGAILTVQSGSLFAQARKVPPPLPEFEALAPKIGEQLPDLTIFDDAGNPVNIRELPGDNYKVLILGCLT
jgi:hypothetical protein